MKETVAIVLGQREVKALLAGGYRFERKKSSGFRAPRVGDILLIREAWARTAKGYVYKADGNADDVTWRSPLHMPMEACRLRRMVDHVEYDAVKGVWSVWLAAAPTLYSYHVSGVDGWRGYGYGSAIWAHSEDEAVREIIARADFELDPPGVARSERIPAEYKVIRLTWPTPRLIYERGRAV